MRGHGRFGVLQIILMQGTGAVDCLVIYIPEQWNSFKATQYFVELILRNKLFTTAFDRIRFKAEP